MYFELYINEYCGLVINHKRTALESGLTEWQGQNRNNGNVNHSVTSNNIQHFGCAGYGND